MTDEEYVKAHLTVDDCGTRTNPIRVFNLSEGVRPLKSWAAAAEFTRDRLEQIRQLWREIALISAYIEYFSDEIAERICEEPVIIECAIDPRDCATFSRILTRLESALTDLRKGMKA